MLESINNIDLVGNQFSGSFDVGYKWHDERFRWNPDEYDNITELIVSPSSLWTPKT
jgi:hypothetical protein